MLVIAANLGQSLDRVLVTRDNLQVIYWEKYKKSDKWKSEKMGKCRQITFDEFYADSERGLNEAKSKLKF